MKKKLSLFLVLLLAVSTLLAACGGSSSEGNNSSSNTGDSGEGPLTDYTVGMVTDTGGVDDKSFNQSAWEGLQKYGEENNLEKGPNGFDYLQSTSDAEYVTNLNTLAKGGFKLVYGIGFLLENAIREVAEQNPNTHFAIVDSVVEGDNVASLTFAEHEGSYLVGVAAAMKSETKRVGFIGGMDLPTIQKFQAGFEAGVKAVDPSIQVDVSYVGSFDDAAKGQAAAAAMYKAGSDVIFHAAGAAGNGLFTEAKNIKENDPNANVWVIGVDRDQAAEGELKDGTTNVTLTSMVKRVDVAVKAVADKGKDGAFPGGETLVFDLQNEGVGIAPTQDNLTPEILEKVAEFTEKIKSGEIVVPDAL